MLKMRYTMLWERIIRGIVITGVSLLWKMRTGGWLCEERGKSGCISWVEQEHGPWERREDGICEERKGQCDWNTENSEHCCMWRGLSFPNYNARLGNHSSTYSRSEVIHSTKLINKNKNRKINQKKRPSLEYKEETGLRGQNGDG